MHQPTVELERPGLPPLTKQREVDEAVVEILGINRSQFAQIVMIAQGEFKKVLSAQTKERARSFATFSTPRHTRSSRKTSKPGSVNSRASTTSSRVR